MLLSSQRLCRSFAVLATTLSGSPYSIQQLACPYLVTGFTPSQTSPNHRKTSFYSSINMAADEESNAFIDKLALILINSQNKQLVARSTGKSVFYTPGGKREQAETDQQALIRECMEELSVNLLSSTKNRCTIEPYGTFQAQAFGKPEGTMVRMTCYRVCPREAELELEGLVKANAEIEELKWIDSSFDRDKLTITGIMILDDLKKNNLID
jgi:8-oxo-dGTP pyrophosphatase MutT (NUDIX family)